MNLRDLSYLVAVVDLRSFIQAAGQCCICQPTLSTQIKKLEESLGVPIFERSNKTVFLQSWVSKLLLLLNSDLPKSGKNPLENWTIH